MKFHQADPQRSYIWLTKHADRASGTLLGFYKSQCALPVPPGGTGSGFPDDLALKSSFTGDIGADRRVLRDKSAVASSTYLGLSSSLRAHHLFSRGRKGACCFSFLEIQPEGWTSAVVSGGTIQEKEIIKGM